MTSAPAGMMGCLPDSSHVQMSGARHKGELLGDVAFFFRLRLRKLYTALSFTNLPVAFC